jgi:hypothetical protein
MQMSLEVPAVVAGFGDEAEIRIVNALSGDHICTIPSIEVTEGYMGGTPFRAISVERLEGAILDNVRRRGETTNSYDCVQVFDSSGNETWDTILEPDLPTITLKWTCYPKGHDNIQLRPDGSLQVQDYLLPWSDWPDGLEKVLRNFPSVEFELGNILAYAEATDKYFSVWLVDQHLELAVVPTEEDFPLVFRRIS